MRWPWSRRPAEPDPPEAAKHALVPPAPPAMGWAFLPPIQRSLAAPMPSITRPHAFPAELPAWRSPAFTGPATHAVVDGAPGGVIDADGGGLGRPTPSPVAAPELTLLPPPRPTSVQRTKIGAPAAVTKRDPGPSPVPDPVDEPAPVRPNELPELPSLTGVGDVHLPVVQRAPVADEPIDAAPEVQPAEGAEPPSAVSATVDAEVPVDARVERPTSLGLGPPLPAIPDTATATPPDTSAAGAPSPLPLVGAGGFTEVPVRRSEVSTVQPSTRATVQRRVDSTVQPNTRATVQRSAEPPPLGPSAPTADLAPASPTTAAVESDAKDDVAPAPPVVGAGPPADVEPGSADASDDHETVAEAGPDPSSDQATPSVLIEPPSMASAPLPLATSMPTTIQRSTERSTPGAPVPGMVVRRAPDLAPRGGERVIPVQRIPADLPATLPPSSASPAQAPASRERLPGASSGRPAAATAVGSTRVQRGFLAAALHRGTAPVAGASSSRPAPVTPVTPVGSTRVQRGFLAAAFHRPTASPAAGTPEPEATVARPDVPLATLPAVPGNRVAVQRAPTDPPVDLLEHAVDVPLGAVATTAPPPPVAVSPAPTHVQRETRDVVPLPLPPTQAPTTVPVQATPTDDGTPTVTGPVPPPADPVGPAPVVARAGEPAATPGATAGKAGAAPGGATDVEALAQRLFSPMLRRIKAELLLDRERRGMRTDAW